MPDFEIVADPDPDLDRFLDLLSRVEEERRQERRKDRHKPRSGDRHKPRSGDWHKSRAVNNRPFIVVDGEGGGKDELGRQNYLLMGAAGIDGTYYQLFEDNRPLTTRECLEFVLALPSTEAATLCSFYFSYDVTHILRDVPDDRIERLLSPKPAQSSRYTHWQQYFLEHVPGQFFRVAKACPIRGKPLKGTARTIHDSGRLFQSPFIEILEKWQVADPESLAFLEKLKVQRKFFTKITSDISKYNEIECRKFAEVLSALREVCLDKPSTVIDFKPAHWRSSGDIATRMLASAKVPKRSALPERSPELQQMTLEAYYGGRNEVSRTGYIGAKTFAYDINSAYPAAIKKLPCALHTRWCEMSPPEMQRLQRDLKARRLVRDLFIADLAFEQSDDSIWGAFPFRTKDGFIRYPLNGSGVYWSPEVVAAANAGVKLQLHKGYIAQTFCDCRTFDWIEPLYRYRLDVGDDAKGYPIKLGLAALNGKFSQRVGAAPWHDRIASGLLMSIVRAQVFEAAASVPWDVMMIATDAIYSTRPLPRLQRTDNLGDWKLKELPDFFVVQSGFYWSPHNVEAIFKSRGIRRSIVAKHAPDFIREWKRFINEFTEDDKIFASSAPVVPIPVDIFIGLRLALELRKRDVAIMRGSWQTELWRQSFRWDKQREGARRIGDFLVHFPIKGKTSDRSTCYDPELLTEFTGQALLLSAMPDFVKVVE